MEELTSADLNLIKESLMYKKQKVEEYNYPSANFKAQQLLDVETVIKKVSYLIKVTKSSS